MKTAFFKSSFKIICALLLVFIINCSSDDGNGGGTSSSNILLTGSIVSFGSVDELSHSDSQSIQVKGDNLSANVSVSVTDNFQLSLDDSSFSSQLTIDKDLVNANNQTLYVRFSPTAMALGPTSGQLSIESDSATTQTIALEGTALSIAPIIAVNSSAVLFGDTQVNQVSEVIELMVAANNLDSSISIMTSDGFEVSIDGAAYSSSVEIPSEIANEDNAIYLRFLPTEVGALNGTVIFISNGASDVEIDLSGNGLPVIHNYPAFQNQRIAFGGGFNQTETAFFDLHADNSNIQEIKMYIQLRCPSGGCNIWDVYANIKVRDTDSGEWYEIGRYITPYGVDNSALDRGFEIDVTDFKSLLEGNTELFARIETWGSDGWELSFDFDYVEGTPDYPYYAVSEVIGYDDWSTSGVVYGSDASAFDLTKSVVIPANAESTHLRTIISGWGHATPIDSDGRPCAEWCYRTHDVKINGSNMFQHDMGPIGCGSNPVSPQNGNWSPDRAGWCPGMAVPVRIDNFASSMSGASFNFEYDYEDWTSDGGNTSGQGGAYYATSTFVVVKSNTPISKPTVNE